MIMKRYRSILALALAFVTAFLVSCGSPAAKVPTTYTAAQIEQIQLYASGISQMQARLPELAKLIQEEDWTFIRNFIRGPLGELRIKMSAIERSLLPNAQPQAKSAGKEVAESLVLIDEAAQKQDYQAAIRSYAGLQRNLNAFLELAPKA